MQVSAFNFPQFLFTDGIKVEEKPPKVVKGGSYMYFNKIEFNKFN